MKAWLLVCLISIGVPPQANQQPDRGSNTYQASQPDQRGSKAPPLVVEGRAMQSDKETAKEDQRDAEQHRTNTWGIGLTFAIALCAVAQVIVYLLQTRLLNKTLGEVHAQAQHMKDQTKILSDSVAVAKQGAEVSLSQVELMKNRERSRLSIEPLPLTAFKTDVEWQEIEFLISNFGATLAMRVRVISNCLLAGNDGFPDRDDFDAGTPRIGSTNDDAILPDHLKDGHHDACWTQFVKPSDPTRVAVPLFWYPKAEDVERIYCAYIHVWGRVDYDDIFGEHHFFRYRFRFHLLRLGKPYEGLDGIIQFPIESVAKWSGYQDEEDEAN